MRFDNGVDTYLTVLTAQTDLYNGQLLLVSARMQRLTNLVGLYRALGGGWIQHTGDEPRRGSDDPGACGRAAPTDHRWWCWGRYVGPGSCSLPHETVADPPRTANRAVFEASFLGRGSTRTLLPPRVRPCRASAPVKCRGLRLQETQRRTRPRAQHRRSRIKREGMTGTRRGYPRSALLRTTGREALLDINAPCAGTSFPDRRGRTEVVLLAVIFPLRGQHVAVPASRDELVFRYRHRWCAQSR